MAYVDLYCERLAPGLLGEPVNALTNLAFFVAAGWVWHRAAKAGPWQRHGRLLACLLALIGAGSMAFHTWATTWAEKLDELPILIFQVVFLSLYCRQVLAWRPLASAGCTSAFVMSIFAAGNFPGLVNGSLPYLPALLVLLGMGAFHRQTGRAGSGAFLGAAALFGVSLFFRSVDLALCSRFPVGTHFLWHLCNAAVLALSTVGLMANRKETPDM